MLKDLIQNGANVQVVMSAADLQEAILQALDTFTKQKEQESEETYYTAKEAANMLGVDISTLWRWDKSGYLTKVKRGVKNYYRGRDLSKILEGAAV